MEAARQDTTTTTSNVTAAGATFVQAHTPTTAPGTGQAQARTSTAQQHASTGAGRGASQPPVAATSADNQNSDNAPSQMKDQIGQIMKKVENMEKMAGTATVEEALQKLMEIAQMPAFVSRQQILNALRTLVDRATRSAKLARFRAFHVPDWEMEYTVNLDVPKRLSYGWVTLGGAPRQDQASKLPCVEMVANGDNFATPDDLFFRNPNEFIAGEIHKNLETWDELAELVGNKAEILN
ncbi:uncharacterized protein [Ptychodera flava]|uniref:uncharacterized protein n=1 Tax=Ptychodera flava TaxID=63121 RepID=UPI00396A3EB5